MDNSQFADNCAEKLVQFYVESRRFLQKGNFNLRQWSTNCSKVKELAKAEGVYCEDKVVKVLGLYWTPDTDMVGLKQDFNWDGKWTKRSALQFTNAIYDPLNCLAPYAIRNRLFLQKLWELKYGWDESF